MTIETFDHVDTGVGRLTYKLQQENIEALLTILLNRCQEVEDALVELANQKSIDLAEGIFLDYIGKLVGVDRDGMSDEDYRVAIRFQISVNTSDGTPNVIIGLIKEFTTSVSVRISESGVAFGTLSFDGQDNIGSDLYDLLQEIRPAGTRWLLHSDFFDSAFLLAYEYDASSTEVFQVTDDGVVFENFEVTNDGVNFEPLFIIEEESAYYTPSLVDGRNYFYYEEAQPFQVTSDGTTYEDFYATTSIGESQLKLVTPYIDDYIPDGELPLHWEVWEESENIEE